MAQFPIRSINIPRNGSPTLTPFLDHTDTSGPGMLSDPVDRRECRYHLFQMVADGTAEFDVELSLDGAHWCVLTTLTGAADLKTYPQHVLPFLRVRRTDSTGDSATFVMYSATENSLTASRP